MKIEWNKVTWYSKILAIILFVGVFIYAFNLGKEYGRLNPSTDDNTISIPAKFPAVVTLGVGQTGKIGNLSITFNALLNDYRCPIDVQCIQAGAVNTNVTFSEGTKTETRNMPSDEVPQKFGKYKISITDVSPPAQSGKEIKQKEYKVIFNIEM